MNFGEPAARPGRVRAGRAALSREHGGPSADRRIGRFCSHFGPQQPRGALPRLGAIRAGRGVLLNQALQARAEVVRPRSSQNALARLEDRRDGSRPGPTRRGGRQLPPVHRGLSKGAGAGGPRGGHSAGRPRAQRVEAQGNRPERSPSSARRCASTTRRCPKNGGGSRSGASLGESLAAQKKFAEAEPLILGSYEGLTDRRKDVTVDAWRRLPEAGRRVIRLYESWASPPRPTDGERRSRRRPAAIQSPRTRPRWDLNSGSRRCFSGRRRHLSTN